MNFKNQARTLENFLEDEFKNRTPLLILKDKSVIYKKMKVKQSKNNKWALRHISGCEIDEFYLKTTATIAAKYYSDGNFSKLNELKMLDFQYWQCAFDEEMFKDKIKSTKDLEKLDIYVARWDLAKSRAELYRKQVSSLFRLAFDK
jgi:hypothetical protein